MIREQIIEADWTWTGERFEGEVQVEVDSQGRIARVGALGLAPTQILRHRALLPGFVNAHSHAFQRGLRGRGELFPQGAGSFWSWREAMYELVESLDFTTFRRLTVQAFREMRAAGTTCVGEFHYLHHSSSGDDFAFDEIVIEAAAEAGIRLVLLETFYKTGGVGQPLRGGQERFRTPSIAGYWKEMDRLAELAAGAPAATLGAVAHSLRAAAPEEIVALHAEARRRGLVFHIHVEEQRQEIADCLAAYGRRPMALLCERIDDLSGVVAIHCTHTEPADLTAFIGRGGRVCVCPTTEGNLGDGIGDFTPLARIARGRPAPLCLGSDSNLRLSMLEEMRWLEFAQRLRSESRGVWRDARGQVGPVLLHAATAGGADALGVPAGRIAPGAWADFVAVDLDQPSLEGCTEETLLDALIFGGNDGAIRATCVGGLWQGLTA